MLSNHDLIVSAYRAFNRRDIDATLALMHPDVDWPNGMEGGRVRGHEQVRAYWSRQWKQIDPRVEPVAIKQDGDGNTVVDVHQTVLDLAGNTLADQHIQHVYSIRDHLISSMDIRTKETQIKETIAGT